MEPEAFNVQQILPIVIITCDVYLNMFTVLHVVMLSTGGRNELQ